MASWLDGCSRSNYIPWMGTCEMRETKDTIEDNALIHLIWLGDRVLRVLWCIIVPGHIWLCRQEDGFKIVFRILHGANAEKPIQEKYEFSSMCLLHIPQNQWRASKLHQWLQPEWWKSPQSLLPLRKACWGIEKILKVLLPLPNNMLSWS